MNNTKPTGKSALVKNDGRKNLFLLGKNWRQEVRRKISLGNDWKNLASDTVSRAIEFKKNELPITWEEGRKVLLPTARNLAVRSQNFVVAHALTGDFTFLDAMLSDGLRVAELDHWNPEHFLDTAELACFIACIRKWTEPVATREQLLELDNVLYERAVKRGLWSLRGGSNWTLAAGNWNIVCNASLMVVASALLQDYPEECGELLERAYSSSNIALNAVGPGGEWHEGITYLDYSAQFAWFAKQATGLHHFQPILDCGRYRSSMIGPSGMIADFGDDLPNCLPPAIGQTGPNPAGSSPFNLLWGAPLPKPPDRFVGRTVACLRTEQGFLAVKLGNTKHAHAHADLGSFIWEAQGKRLVSDPGRLRYDIPG
jgi:hypothetical protein